MANRGTKRSASGFWIWALLCGVASGALAQLQTGDLYGTVKDSKGEALPGVTVTLKGPGPERTQATDTDGQFRFVGLYPGDYSLEAKLDGFTPVQQTEIGIRIGSRASLEVVMNPAVTETITVSSEAAVLNPRDQSQGPALSQRELDQLPTARDPWSLLRQAPGVLTDRINVGGNESGQQADFIAGGATSADNTFSVDGVILSDMAAVGGSATYFDFGAYEEIQLTTSTTDVSVQTAGVTVNQVTKRGTNDWKGDGRYLRTEGSWQSDPKETNGNRIDSVEEYGLNFGGPLMQDHLWAWASYGESDVGNIAQGGQLDRTELEDFNTKLNFSVGSNSGVLHYWTNDKLKNGRNAGPLFAPESTWDQTTPSDIWKIEDTHIFGSNLYLTGLYSVDDGAFTLAPKGGLDADMFIDSDGVVHGSYFDFDQTATITQYKLDGSGFFGTGSWNHELKFGINYREQENTSMSSLPRGRYVEACEDYGCDLGEDVELVIWVRHNVAVTSEYQAAWLQDTLSSGRWTVNAGLRWDKQKGENRAHFDPGTPEARGYLPAIQFPGNNADGLDWDSIVPRVGVTYAAGEESRTLLRGTFSQYAAQLGQSIVSRTDPLAPYSYVYYYFTDANRNLVFDPDESASAYYYYAYGVDVNNPSSLRSPNRNDPDLKPYVTDELTFNVQHAFENNLGISATLIYRNTSDLLEFRDLVTDESGVERQATRDDYVFDGQDEVTLPDGSSVLVDNYAFREDVSPTGGLLLTNGDREIDYLGITLGVHKPMANRWSLRGNLTWSDSKLKVGDDFRFHDDPTNVIFTNGDGYFGAIGDDDDIFAYQSSYRAKRGVVLQNAWSFNISGIYQVAPDRPWGFDVAGNLSGREGYPSPPFIGSNGRQRQVTSDIDQFRLDDVISLDLGIKKELKFNDLGVTLSLDAFNLLNNQPVLQVNRNYNEGPDQTVLERLSPRVFRWGVSFHYR